MYARISSLEHGYARRDFQITYGRAAVNTGAPKKWYIEWVSETAEEAQILTDEGTKISVHFPCNELPGFPHFAALSGNSVAAIMDGIEDASKLCEVAKNAVKNYFAKPSSVLFCNHPDTATPMVMGILNLTPDSFSDGGLFMEIESALERAGGIMNAGSEIIDIGGESTRPGSEPVSADTELGRVIPFLKKIQKKAPKTLLSIDTTKYAVASEALHSGAKIINDISAGRYDARMFELAAENNAAYVLMHMQNIPATMQISPHYISFFREVAHFLVTRARTAAASGVKTILLDPGIGFGKTADQNFEILQRLQELKSFGYPILIGLSRKSFIGKVTGLEIPRRDTCTAALEMDAMKRGVSVVRTHNVENTISLRKIYHELEK